MGRSVIPAMPAHPAAAAYTPAPRPPFKIDPEMLEVIEQLSDEELQEFTALQADTDTDEQCELYVYLCFEVFEKLDSEEYLSLAITTAKRLVASAVEDGIEKARRTEILDYVSAFQLLSQKDLPPGKLDVVIKAISLYLPPLGSELRRRRPTLLDIINLQYINIVRLMDSDEACRIIRSSAGELDRQSQLVVCDGILQLLTERLEASKSPQDMKNLMDFIRATADKAPPGDLQKEKYIQLLTRKANFTARTDKDTNSVDIIQAAEALLYFRFIKPESRAGKIMERGIELLEDYLESQVRVGRWPATLARNLIDTIEMRWYMFKNKSDLERGLKVCELSLTVITAGHPNWVYLVDRRCSWWEHQFQVTQDLEYLEKDIKFREECVGHPGVQDDEESKAQLNFSLAKSIHTRFGRTENIEDLRRSTKIMEAAMEEVPQNSPLLVGFLFDYSKVLADLVDFDTTGTDTLNRVIEVLTGAIDCLDDGNDFIDEDLRHYLPTALAELASYLGARFDKTGAMGDINKAIEKSRRSIALVAEMKYNDGSIASGMISLSILFSRKFRHTEQISDLDEAIKILEAALTLNIDSSVESHIQVMLGRLTFDRSRLKKNYTYPDDDLDTLSKKVEDPLLTPAQRIPALSNYAFFLAERFSSKKDPRDLERAIEASTTLLSQRPDDFVVNSHLSSLFQWRFAITDDQRDFEKSKEYTKKALNCPDKAPDMLSIALRNRASQMFLEQVIHTGQLTLETKPNSAARADFIELSEHYEELVNILTSLSPRSLANTDKQQRLAKFFGVPSDAAAIALVAGRAPFDALRQLELGRGIISGLMFEMRSDLTTLEAKYPELAQEYIYLRDALESNSDSTSSDTDTSRGDSMLLESHMMHRQDADARLDNLLKEIRSQPGFEDFQAPLSDSQFKLAAGLDPVVVVNISRIRCDAFIITKHRIRVIKLPCELTEVEENAALLRKNSNETEVWQVLEWLWTAIVEPVLVALGINGPPTDDKWPHIWWIPTGSLSQLPLHAAGKHTAEKGETALDRVVSSYALSIKVLLYGRQRKSDPNPTDSSDTEQMDNSSGTALVVSMDKTPGHPNLAFVKEEVSKIRQLFPKMNLQPVELQQQHRDDVLSQLSTCKIFHFAGHGSFSRENPSESCLLLEDWETSPLTVAKLWEHKIQKNPPFLAYLSACSTGANDETKYSDEGINLIGAYQLAGFRHVIGTLWEVDDQCCVEIASSFYQTICKKGLTNQAVPLALHQAMRNLRDSSVGNSFWRGNSLRTTRRNSGLHLLINQPRSTKGLRDIRNAKVVSNVEQNFYWIPYVHFGA
ncbi:hypothetical protein TWF694_000279 [Orbilia ellipsospora]|uniref:CHAT domain-containing protein n=1 Tax=Orbilia ellipsospora TaxID=2528407 RepID=A0AAV9XN60_9PEZI